MSNIRVTYSGLISFVFGFASLITGLIFTIIVTRSLTPEEFGTWGIIGTLVGYVIMMNPMVAYWSTREIARGNETGRTSVQTSFMLSIVAVLIYFIIAIFFGQSTEIETSLLFFAAIMIPAQFVQMTLVSITVGHKPYLAEGGLMVFEIFKIPLGFVLVYFLDMGLEGAIITITGSYVASAIFLGIKSRQRLKGKFKKKFVKKWIRLVWLPAYPKIASIFTRSDVAVFTLITGSVGGIAYWSAANSVAHMIKHAAKINRAVYPKLLGGGKKEYFQENIVRVFYFVFPLAAMTIIFAKPGLFILNPLYAEAEIVVIALVPLIFLRVINSMCSQALKGIEKVDTNEQSSFKDYIKSKLFFLPTLENIQRGLYLLVLILVLIFTSGNYLEIELLVFWALVSFITQLPFTIYLLFLIKKEFNPTWDYKTISKYLISSIVVFGIIQIIMKEYLIYKIEIFEFVPNFLPFLICSIFAYLGMTYLLDKKTRNLVKSIIKEMKLKG